MPVRNNIFLLFVYACVSLLFCGCKSPMTYEQYLVWLNDEGNGFSQTTKSRGLAVNCKYMPPVLLAYKDVISDKEKCISIDSITHGYSKYLTFYVNISPQVQSVSNPNADIIKDGVADYSEYKERFTELAFNLQEYFSVELEDGTIILPSGVNVENTYGLSPDLNIIITFPKKELFAEKKIDILFRDEIFLTGLNHFVFETKSVENPPILKY